VLHIDIKKEPKIILNKLISLFKLITESFEEGDHKNDFSIILRSLISPFTKLSVKFPWIIVDEVWNRDGFQSNFWKNIGKLNSEEIPIELEYISEDDIKISISIINEQIFPWIKALVEKSQDKNQFKTVSKILWNIYSLICTLFPPKLSMDPNIQNRNFWR